MAWAFFSVLLLMLPCGLQAFHGRRFFCPRHIHVGCRTDAHCPTDSCCQVTFVNRWRYLGTCVPRDPDSMMCTRPKQCYEEKQCGAGSCCRFPWSKGKGGGAAVGECDKLGQEGDECTVVTYGRFTRLCPCAEGLVCDAPPSSGTGQCRAPTTTTMAPTATTTEDNNPCGCPNLQQLCCLGDNCRTRPVADEVCGQDTCPCLNPLVCSDPVEGNCVMPVVS